MSFSIPNFTINKGGYQHMAKYKKRKDGRYATNVTIGKDWNTGKPILIRVYGRSITELEKNKANVLSDYNNGRMIITKKVTFKEYANKWLEGRKPYISNATHLMYKSVLDNHLGSLKKKEPKDIIKSDVQDLINSRYQIPRTCKKIKVTLNQIFESAIDDNLCYRNPCKNIVLPKYEPSKKRPLTSFEDTLSDVTEFSDRECAFVLLLKWCGLRPEECLALQKQDFNLEENVVNVKNAVEFIHNQPHLKELKTKSSYRSIPLIGKCQTFIPYYLSNLQSDYLFTTVRSKEHITDSSYRRMWETIKRKMTRKAAELKYDVDLTSLTPYIFRHNYATVLDKLGVSDKEKQYLMGHSSIQTTNNWYIHIDPTNLKATNTLEEYAQKRLS